MVALAAAAAIAASVAAVAAIDRPGGHPAGHAVRAVPPLAPSRSRALPARPAPSAPVRRPPSAAPPAPHRAPAPALTLTPVLTEVAGVGCPSDGGDNFTFDNAPTGPGWIPSVAGGWTGNGCDGSTLWTMDPNGNQPVPSTLTWTFSPAGASRCTLAVFVPTLNALGVSDYSVSVGPPGAGQVVAAVAVGQPDEAGQWFTLGTFTVSGSSLEITASPVPGASGPGHHGAIAASAARAVCTG